MTVVGQNEKPSLSGLCQLPPAADVPLHEAMRKMWTERDPDPPQQVVSSFDLLVGDEQEPHGYFEAESLSCLKIDGQREFGR
jgi:hypothetical protein